MLRDLIEQISMDNNPGTLDDMIPDMLADNEGESIQELVDYIKQAWGNTSEGVNL